MNLFAIKLHGIIVDVQGDPAFLLVLIIIYFKLADWYVVGAYSWEPRSTLYCKYGAKWSRDPSVSVCLVNPYNFSYGLFESLGIHLKFGIW